MLYLRSDHWEMVGSEILSITSVFLCQVQCLHRWPVPRGVFWWLLSRVGVFGAKVRTTLSSRWLRAWHRHADASGDGKPPGCGSLALTPGLGLGSKMCIEIIVVEQAWGASVGLVEPLTRVVWGKLVKFTTHYPHL